MSEENKIKLNTRTFRVPITRDEEGKIIEGIDLASYPIHSEEEIEMKSWVDLPNQGKKVSEFNQRQLKYAEHDLTRDYILKKIIIK